jgi:hypothetical protein
MTVFLTGRESNTEIMAVEMVEGVVVEISGIDKQLSRQEKTVRHPVCVVATELT